MCSISVATQGAKGYGVRKGAPSSQIYSLQTLEIKSLILLVRVMQNGKPISRKIYSNTSKKLYKKKKNVQYFFSSILYSKEIYFT